MQTNSKQDCFSEIWGMFIIIWVLFFPTLKKRIGLQTNIKPNKFNTQRQKWVKYDNWYFVCVCVCVIDIDWVRGREWEKLEREVERDGERDGETGIEKERERERGESRGLWSEEQFLENYCQTAKWSLIYKFGNSPGCRKAHVLKNVGISKIITCITVWSILILIFNFL